MCLLLLYMPEGHFLLKWWIKTKKIHRHYVPLVVYRKQILGRDRRGHLLLSYTIKTSLWKLCRRIGCVYEFNRHWAACRLGITTSRLTENTQTHSLCCRDLRRSPTGEGVGSGHLFALCCYVGTKKKNGESLHHSSRDLHVCRFFMWHQKGPGFIPPALMRTFQLSGARIHYNKRCWNFTQICDARV